MHIGAWEAMATELSVTETWTRRFIERWASFSISVNVAVRGAIWQKHPSSQTGNARHPKRRQTGEISEGRNVCRLKGGFLHNQVAYTVKEERFLLITLQFFFGIIAGHTFLDAVNKFCYCPGRLFRIHNTVRYFIFPFHRKCYQ